MPEPLVERTGAEQTRPLRQRVLRPQQAPDALALPGDDDPETGHFVARDADGTVVGTATVRREPPPEGLDPTVGAAALHAWRLRGMAVEEALRGHGTGQRLLAAVEEHVGSHGTPALLWCNARTTAEGFYARSGWRAVGLPWEDPEIGPHVRMVKRLG